MWVGWNSKFDQSAKSTQNIWYLPQINESPTSHAVVAETLKRAIQIADECGKTQIASTYDLAIAKMALQIQKAESPLYDRVFVNLGAFHVELAFFCAVGKYIAESGGPFILSESGVLQSGSLKGFINGKAYNRCKRLHQFLVDDLLIEKKESLPLPLKENLSKEVLEVLQSYEDYRNDTLEGKHGKTAKFWAGYIEMVNLYHTFSRSIREGDFHLFIHCLPKITDYFFSFNHINYARWLVRFHDNLLKINETHPELSAEFQEGAFALKRTKKPFSGIPIDLTLEQTINADAASQRTGVTSMTNSIAARQRWAESHYIRTSLISHFFDELEMNTSDDTSKDLRAHRMHKNTADFLRIGKAIDETMNPFSKDIDPHHLFNIATGKSASDDTCNFLLDVASIGKKAREKFISECISDPERFEKSLKKIKLSTFANEGVVKAVKGATKRLYEVKMERDLFGQILVYSLQNKIDMGELLKYPLTPVPLTLSLSHIDGSMLKSPKAALLREIESRIVSAAPTRIDSVIVDGFFFLHLKQDLPESFGGVSKDILRRLCNLKASRIDLVFDQIVSPSIKDCERDSRAGSENRSMSYSIGGPGQKRPRDFLKALRNDGFKDSLVNYLVESWQDESNAQIIGEKQIYVTCKDKCYLFQVINGSVSRTEDETLRSHHEEADSRMFFHLAKISSLGEQETAKNIVLRLSDTDVAIVGLGNLHLLPENVTV